jgi:hypothetical protein
MEMNNAPLALTIEKLCIHIVSCRIQNRTTPCSNTRSQQSLSSQLDLPRRLPYFETTFAYARHRAIAKLDLVFDFRKCARTVVCKVNTAERMRTEVFVAMG